jgi:hypothetical protein
VWRPLGRREGGGNAAARVDDGRGEAAAERGPRWQDDGLGSRPVSGGLPGRRQGPGAVAGLVLVVEQGACERGSPAGHGWPAEWAWKDVGQRVASAQGSTPRFGLSRHPGAPGKDRRIAPETPDRAVDPEEQLP